MDGEIAGNGNAYDFGARTYDARLGRWWSVDCQFALQVDQSVYKSFLNNPILFVDPDGNTEWITTYVTYTNGTTIKVMDKVSDKVMTDGIAREVPSTFMGIVTGKHLVVDYYDFETINYVRINSDGSTTVTESIKILYGIRKDTDWVPSYDWAQPGETKDPDGFNNGPGVQKGGFWLVSQGGGADPTRLKQVSEFTDAERLDVEDLLTALDKGVKGSTLKPAKGEMLNGAEFLNRIFSIIEEGRNLCKQAPKSNSAAPSANQQPDSVMVEYYKETISGNQVFHHHSSKFVSVKDTVDGIIKGDKTERINMVRK